MRRSSLLLCACLVAACGQADVSGDAATAPATYDSEQMTSDWDVATPSDLRAVVALPDGRKVSMYYARKDQGLAVQVYSPDEDAWTAPEIVYDTETDPCQGIEIVEQDGTVAAYADWALYCYDGEPPSESVALVSTGDLTDWDTDLTEGFDGWERVTVSPDGDEAVWTHTPDPVTSRDTLTWTPDDGFDKQMDQES